MKEKNIYVESCRDGYISTLYFSSFFLSICHCCNNFWKMYHTHCAIGNPLGNSESGELRRLTNWGYCAILLIEDISLNLTLYHCQSSSNLWLEFCVYFLISNDCLPCIVASNCLTEIICITNYKTYIKIHFDTKGSAYSSLL